MLHASLLLSAGHGELIVLDKKYLALLGWPRELADVAYKIAAQGQEHSTNTAVSTSAYAHRLTNSTDAIFVVQRIDAGELRGTIL